MVDGNEDGRRPVFRGQMMLDVAIRWSQGCAVAAHGIRWAAAEGGEQAQATVARPDAADSGVT